MVMKLDTTHTNYWLNWRFLLCGIWILVGTVVSSFLIWKYEGNRKKYENRPSGNRGEAAGCLYEDETWGTCLKSVHQIWLLLYRILAFCLLLALLLANGIKDPWIFYYYAQWSLTLVTVYFGFGSVISTRGYLNRHNEVDPERVIYLGKDSERGSLCVEDVDIPTVTRTLSQSAGTDSNRTPASFSGYVLQIIFQLSAGAVVLTDAVFWLIVYPFLISSSYRLTFLDVCLHSVNAVLLLGDASLNRLRFPFFRIAYFVLWTCVFIIFQWIFHVFGAVSWAYVFLDLSSPYAPIWYLGLGLLHFPCFGIFTLAFKIKRRYSSK